MKKLSFLMIVCLAAILLLFAACDKNCNTKPPKDVKPIDWENYNDVYTVYWNYVSLYSKRKQEDEGKIIKISGWKAWSYDAFSLCDDAKYADRNLGYTAAFPHIDIKFYCPEVHTMLDTCDLTKKCFVKGKLSFHEREAGLCNKVIPVIIVTDINDVYFK